MLIQGMTEGEFLRLSTRVRHKVAAPLLRRFYEERDAPALADYRRIEKWLGLPHVEPTHFQALSDRYHDHLKQAEVSWKEHNLLLPQTHQIDAPSAVAYLPLAIYLDNLRSAFNVGSILRTTEAFRLGTVHFGGNTPYIDNPKVQKTSMCAFDKVPCRKGSEALPGPLIALETLPGAPTLFDFPFPEVFTLVLGNEEYGVSATILSQVSAVVQIPLWGFKNSLNVASAYAIAAGVISHKRRQEFTALF
jgi:tRNA G18 (ribose-2'-O)-methylase SpoU